MSQLGPRDLMWSVYKGVHTPYELMMAWHIRQFLQEKKIQEDSAIKRLLAGYAKYIAEEEYMRATDEMQDTRTQEVMNLGPDGIDTTPSCFSYSHSSQSTHAAAYVTALELNASEPHGCGLNSLMDAVVLLTEFKLSWMREELKRGERTIEELRALQATLNK